MEELINELDIFVNEKAILSAQIKDIENKILYYILLIPGIIKSKNLKKIKNI